MADRKK